MNNIDFSSIRGTIITIGSLIFSFSTINPFLQFISFIIAIGVGATTLYLNIKKIKKS